MKFHDSEEFKDFEKRVQKELVPMIKNSNVFVSINPVDVSRIDVKFAIEIGIAVLLNKKIIAAIRPGTQVSEKFTRVVDKFVELDMTNPDWQKRIMEAIEELGLKDKGK